MKTILVGTDFSERSDRALRRATLLARQTGAALRLVHVVDDDQPVRIVEAEREAAAGLLQQQAATLREHDGLDCAAHVVLADPFAGLIEAVRQLGADLLVIGPHRRQILRDVFIGTTAERTIRAAACPVLMANAPPVGPYRHALLATDLSEGSQGAFRRLDGLGFGHRLRSSVLHVFDATEAAMMRIHATREDDREAHLREAGAEAARALTEFLRELPQGPMIELVRHRSGSAASEILAAATEAEADLIVVGTQSRGAFETMVLGSVARQVLRSATADVLAVPPAPA
ncbi:universal stress protein [Rhodovulum sp. YEN HP10]|uniref:universal stress protein n=1 Tax=Rhodovulum sp. HP10 TaxID=3387397 RepID=UPI0039E0E7A9